MATLQLKRQDRKRLGEYRHAKYDPLSGLVWIEDGTAGIAHSAHPNVEANKYSRKDKRFVGWIEVRGFLYSPERFVSTDLDRLAAEYCKCPTCR